MATYAVGDIQGCLLPLQQLLASVNFDPQKDKLWLVGDLINRGPHSLETLRFIYAMRDSVITVLGNHDLHLLAVAHGQRKPSRSDTLSEILAADDSVEMLQWLRRQPLLYSDKELGFTLVHAGIPPNWNLKQAHQYAREVETVLRSKHYESFLAKMYGNEPNIWSDQLQGVARWRMITNYFTRMRLCNSEGELELTYKGGLNGGPAQYAPWFMHPDRKTSDQKIIFGHWAALEGHAPADNVYPLDTGCVWGGKMTMMRLEDEQLFQSQCIS